MAIKRFCDVCGQELEGANPMFTINITKRPHASYSAEEPHRRYAEICEACCTAVKKTITARKKGDQPA